jgi:hypothetical protein
MPHEYLPHDDGRERQRMEEYQAPRVMRTVWRGPEEERQGGMIQPVVGQIVEDGTFVAGARAWSQSRFEDHRGGWVENWHAKAHTELGHAISDAQAAILEVVAKYNLGSALLSQAANRAGILMERATTPEEASVTNAEPQYDKSEIKRLVWTGPTVETGDGQIVHGVVGLARDGKFAAGVGTIYHEHGLNNRISYEVTYHQWQNQPYEHKEHAIFSAREMVNKEVERYSGDPVEPPLSTEAPKGILDNLFARIAKRQAKVKEPQRGRDRGIDR